MKCLGASRSDAISPTAYYTGNVWSREGLGPPELSTWQGRVLHCGSRPVQAASRLVGAPTVDEFLLARHRVIDHLLESAIASGEISQVIELAAGMSPRGYRLAQRHGAKLTVVEADLPAMVRRKRKVLGGLGSLGPHHRVAVVDVLQTEGEHSLHALAATLDSGRGLAILTEGLLNYLTADSLLDLWRRIAEVCSSFPAGRYLSDLHLRDDLTGPIAQLFLASLGVFVRGNVHLHFVEPAEAVAALRGAGFGSVTLRRPAEFTDDLPGVSTQGARVVRLIEAQP